MSDTLQRMERDMTTGVLQLLVLATIRKVGPIHGYGLLKAMTEATGRAAWKEGTVYPLLTRLEKEGHLQSSWGEAANGPRRKDYAITPSGGRLLREASASWKELREHLDTILEAS